jgi:hypothetical protein
MVRWYKTQKRRFASWIKYIVVWIRDQLKHMQLQDILLILIFIIFGILLGLIISNKILLYHESCAAGVEQLYLFSTIPQSMAAIFALTFSLLLVALQHVGSNYTPRAFMLHTVSLYYFLFFMIFLFTIGYAIFLNGKFNKYQSSLSSFKIDLLELLFFLSLAFMLPFSIRSVRLMNPSEIMRRLSWKITERRFNNYGLSKDSKNKVDRMLQPIFDIAKACIRQADLRSLEEGLDFFSQRLSIFIRRCKWEDSNSLMAKTLFAHYLGAAYYSNEHNNISGCKAIIKSLRSILDGYKLGKFRISSRIFLYFIERIEVDIERFNTKIYKDRYMELHQAVSQLRDNMADILS